MDQVPVNIDTIKTICHHERNCIVGELLTIFFILGNLGKDGLCICVVVGKRPTTNGDPNLNWITEARLHRLDRRDDRKKALWCLRIHCCDLEGLGIDIGKSKVDVSNRFDGDLGRLEAVACSPSAPV